MEIAKHFIAALFQYWSLSVKKGGERSQSVFFWTSLWILMGATDYYHVSAIPHQVTNESVSPDSF
jgi:hypothetical protein